MSMSERVQNLLRGIIVAIIVLVVVGTVLGFSVISSVGVSEVAVIIDPVTGSTAGRIIGPRIFFKAPWQYVARISIAVESLDMWTDPETGERGEWPAIRSLTKDGLEVYVDITVRWRVDPEGITTLYSNYPDLRWEGKTLVPLLRETVRNIIANYTAVETIEKRAEISRKIVDLYNKAVENEKSLGRSIVIEGVDLRNIELPRNFKVAVEQKLSEEQQKIAAQFRRERILIEANATATARILEATGEAEAKLIAANATAKSIRLILRSAGNESRAAEIYLTYTLLRELVSQGGNVYIVVVGGTGGGGVQVVPIPIGGKQ